MGQIQSDLGENQTKLGQLKAVGQIKAFKGDIWLDWKVWENMEFGNMCAHICSKCLLNLEQIICQVIKEKIR